MNNLTNREQSIENLNRFKKFIADITATHHSNIADLELSDDIKYGLVDGFLFGKMKPDKNGFYSSLRIITRTFDSIQELMENISKYPLLLESKVVIAYRPVNNKIHFTLVNKLNLTKYNIKKYLLLI